MLINQNVTLVTENESKLLISGRAEQLKEKQQFEIKVLFIFINPKKIRWSSLVDIFTLNSSGAFLFVK